MRFLSVALVCTLVLATPAGARSYYYYKENVSRDLYRSDRAECQRLMGGVRSSSPQSVYMPSNPNLTIGQNAAAAGIASFFAGMLKSGERRKTANAVERTFMADKGYARYLAPAALAEEIGNIENPEVRLDRYFALA